ncbi:unnamed protein product [Boreogadus saida]
MPYVPPPTALLFLPQGYECECRAGWEGPRCQRETDECASQPCANDATCVDLLGGYRCECGRGWAGPSCTLDVDECESGPCLNGASCRQAAAPGDFLCTCGPLFTGPRCGDPRDPCDPAHSPCLHGSACLPRPDGGASCRCPAGASVQRAANHLIPLSFYAGPPPRPGGEHSGYTARRRPHVHMAGPFSRDNVLSNELTGARSARECRGTRLLKSHRQPP